MYFFTGKPETNNTNCVLLTGSHEKIRLNKKTGQDRDKLARSRHQGNKQKELKVES